VVRTRVDGPRIAPVGRSHRNWSRAVTAAVVAMLLVLIPSTVAHADPAVSEIEAQIAQVWAESEPLIEQYNSVHQQFEQNQAKQAELAAAIEPLQVQFELAQARVGAMAAQIYKGGDAGLMSALLSGGSPQAMADKLSFIDRLARDQKVQLGEVVTMKEDYDRQKAPIDQLVAELAAQDKDLADKKAVITDRINQLQVLRRQAYGNSGGTGSFRPWPCPATYAPTPGYTAAAFACSQAGIPYVWAAAGPDAYDCSGLTLQAWAQVGVYLPHNAAAQRRSMPYVDGADLQVGDLVFYYSDLHHVAIYVGDGKVMQAPQAGDYVRMTDMNTSPIHSFGRPG
jgi:peptidoglycan DL-endopeptidase CwlO